MLEFVGFAYTGFGLVFVNDADAWFLVLLAALVVPSLAGTCAHVVAARRGATREKRDWRRVSAALDLLIHAGCLLVAAPTVPLVARHGRWYR